MPEPRIQYAKTEDGVDIAFFAIGEGPAILSHTPMGGYSNIRLEWEYPDLRRWYEKVAERHTVIRYDARGMGMSQRDGFEFSIEGYLADGEAVVRKLGLTKYSLLSFAGAMPFAIAHAARHPEGVSHVIAWQPIVASPEPNERELALRELMEKDWVLWTEAQAHNVLGWSQGELAHNWAKYIRQTASQETVVQAMPVIRSLDVRPYLADVHAPTLLLSRPASPTHSEAFMRECAAGLRNASVVLLEGRETVPFLGDSDAVIAAIESFLGDAPSRPAPASAPVSGTAVILFTDIADSTGMTERMGDVAFRDASRTLDAGLRAAIRESGGVTVEAKTLGDGVLATFPSAAQAIDGARRCLALSAASELGLHIGLHAGDVIREDNNVFGGAVNIAARICALSAPGEILVSDVVRGMARSSAGVEFADRGDQEMKGVGEPVRLYEVKWEDAG